MKKIAILICCVLFSNICGAAPPDYRPKFDKSSYVGTAWTQVNPWWLPSKQWVDDSGGPNYARKKHMPFEQWGSAMSDSYHYGRINWQVELHVPAPGYANTMKQMMKQVKDKGIDAKFAIFLLYYGKKDVARDIEKTVNQLNMLKDELNNDPAIFRVDGAPVISIYTGGYFTPEEWGKVIPAVEEKCGKFIWLLNTCRGPAPDSDPVKGGDWVRNLLPYFDGVSQYGNYSNTSQAAHHEFLGKIMHEEYPDKIFEVSVQNAYSNHFHFGGVATHLSEKWRKSWDTALKVRPDSIVMTNFFDHYENSLILPCYEREDFLLRYAEVRLAQWRREDFPKEKTPELVVTNYTTILLGSQKLDFEVIGFPIDSEQKNVMLNLDVCDTSGKVLYTFPSKEMDLSKLSVETFSIPSEQFADVRGIVPRLRYRWNKRDFSMNFNPMTLVSPSLRTNLMFWARSTRNVLICNVIDPKWTIDGVTPGGTFEWQDDGIVAVTSEVKPVFGSSPRNGDGSFRLMRNGLEFYSITKNNAMFFTRAFTLPSPADALNYYHLEYENANGYRHQTLPVWVSNGRRQGRVKMPVRCSDKVRELEIEAMRVPFFYYPCDRDEEGLTIDRAGYMHNGRISGSGYGGGHLGYTGYYHYHNGPVAPDKKSIFTKDEQGNGMLKFNGKEYIMIMGGTAFPGSSTYEISIRPTEIGSRMGIIGTANNQINLTLEEDGHLKVTRGSEVEGEGGSKPVSNFTCTVNSKTVLEAGKWYQLAVVYDLKTLKLYINGTLEGMANCPPKGYHEFINHLTVGSLCGWVFKTNTFFKGDIRRIRIYGRNLGVNEFLK